MILDERYELSNGVLIPKMGLEYIDMIIIHSPQLWTKFRESEHFYEENKEVWRALEDAYQAGKVRAIGVSNGGETGNLLWLFSICTNT